MKIRVVYSGQRKVLDAKINDLSELEKLISDDVLSVVIDGEIFYKLGDKFYHIPANNNDGHRYLEALNKYKALNSSSYNEKDYSGENA